MVQAAISEERAQAFAQEWIAAWNNHDLEHILEHYSEDIEFASPFVRLLNGTTGGILRGKEALRAYFVRGLDAYPELRFNLETVFTGVDSVTLVYQSVNNRRAAETMLFDTNGKVQRVFAHYSPAVTPKRV